MQVLLVSCLGTLDTYGHLFPDRLDEVSKKIHKRRAKQLAKA
ncbi:hypothetical protein AB0I49_26945 [Streptomyces sp. NPDC050617]